ncbi:DoxX family membrane protein [Riemerella anatipestifer]|nr:DoxX family membrane protein [Riemerella anatipestifer]MDY3324479.1 DoxX family membrane protein [Riemerella anatipestifer]MDY3353294.1 DoxX family membrane protein [Riemerella anatipestifer]
MKTLKVINTVLCYLFRAFLAYMFIPHGWEKLTTKINPQEYVDFGLGGDFLDFYLIWENTGFIYLIGFTQLVGGLLLIPRRTYLFGTIWLLPMSIGMVGCHWYISHATDFLWFDMAILMINFYLIAIHLPELTKVLFKKCESWI